MLPAVPVQVRGTVKLLPAQQALLNLDLQVEGGMPVEVVRTVEPLAADLAQELLVVGVRVNEDVPLELMLVRKLLPTDLASDGHLSPPINPLTAHDHAPHHLHGLDLVGMSLDEGQPFPVCRVAVEQPPDEGPLGDVVGHLQHVVVLLGINGGLKKKQVFGLGEVDVCFRECSIVHELAAIGNLLEAACVQKSRLFLVIVVGGDD